MRSLPLLVSFVARSQPIRPHRSFLSRSITRKMSSTTAEDEIKSVIEGQFQGFFDITQDFTQEKYDELWAKYWKPDGVLIRPSGNPMGKEIWGQMLASDAVNYISGELLEVNSVNVFAGGAAAVATYTTHDKFTYMGTPNDDIAKFTVVLEKQEDGTWIIVHGHRGTGQKPE